MKFLIIFVLLILSSCVRDLTCVCTKKKGAKLIFAILLKGGTGYVREKRVYHILGDYDTDTSYRTLKHSMQAKYDSLSLRDGNIYFIGVLDSFRWDTLRVRGAELSRCRNNGYQYKCWQ